MTTLPFGINLEVNRAKWDLRVKLESERQYVLSHKTTEEIRIPKLIQRFPQGIHVSFKSLSTLKSPTHFTH